MLKCVFGYKSWNMEDCMLQWGEYVLASQKKKKKKKKQLEISILNHKHENEKHKALRYTEEKICKFSGKLSISPTANPKDEIQKSQSHVHWRDI